MYIVPLKENDKLAIVEMLIEAASYDEVASFDNLVQIASEVFPSTDFESEFPIAICTEKHYSYAGLIIAVGKGYVFILIPKNHFEYYSFRIERLRPKQVYSLGIWSTFEKAEGIARGEFISWGT